MPTLTIKWLNGDVQSLEVLPNTPIYKVILQLGLTLLETIFMSEWGVIFEHYHKLTEDTFVFILVQPPPITILVYNGCGVDYYISTMEPETLRAGAAPKRFTPEVKYDKMFVDVVSYSSREEIHQRLGVLNPQNLCRLILTCTYQTISSYPLQEIGEIGWQDFIYTYTISRGVLADVFFPSVSERMKLYGRLMIKEWFSYFLK